MDLAGDLLSDSSDINGDKAYLPTPVRVLRRWHWQHNEKSGAKDWGIFNAAHLCFYSLEHGRWVETWFESWATHRY